MNIIHKCSSSKGLSGGVGGGFYPRQHRAQNKGMPGQDASPFQGICNWQFAKLNAFGLWEEMRKAQEECANIAYNRDGIQEQGVNSATQWATLLLPFCFIS